MLYELIMVLLLMKNTSDFCVLFFERTKDRALSVSVHNGVSVNRQTST